jgi:hypothetical protein
LDISPTHVRLGQKDDRKKQDEPLPQASVSLTSYLYIALLGSLWQHAYLLGTANQPCIAAASSCGGRGPDMYYDTVSAPHLSPGYCKPDGGFSPTTQLPGGQWGNASVCLGTVRCSKITLLSQLPRASPTARSHGRHLRVVPCVGNW